MAASIFPSNWAWGGQAWHPKTGCVGDNLGFVKSSPLPKKKKDAKKSHQLSIVNLCDGKWRR